MPNRTNAALLTILSAAALFTAASSHAHANYPQPLPSGFSPTSGGPGTVITVTGTGFTGLSQVWIGNAHDANVYVVSDKEVKVTVPADATTSHLGFINPERSEFTSVNFTVTKGGAAKPAPAPAPAPVVKSTAPPSSAAVSGTSWVYYNGVFDWPGDYSFVATPDYLDTSGGPLSGLYDVKVAIDSPWGGWLPYAKNWNFNSNGYTKLTFALKPTIANQSWSVYFVKVGDVPVGIYLDVSKYGPTPVAGQWATYTVPLADLGVLGTSIYKFCIQDQTGSAGHVWYVDNVGFEP